jgi:hypothetical protein
LTKLWAFENRHFCMDATQKSARVVERRIVIEFQLREPIFEKCSHLREKGGVLTLKTPRGARGNALTPIKISGYHDPYETVLARDSRYSSITST